MMTGRGLRGLLLGKAFVMMTIVLSVIITRPAVVSAAPLPEFATITTGCTLIGTAEQTIVYYNFYNIPPGSHGSAFLTVSLTPNGPLTVGWISGNQDLSTAPGLYYMQLFWSDGLGGFGHTNREQVRLDSCPNSLIPSGPYVAMASEPNDQGYWTVRSDGEVFPNAADYGSLFGTPLPAPIVGMAATPDGEGYWFVTADGSVFGYGDAQLYGSAASMHLAKPVVGVAVTPDGGGYWLVASDGGVFAYGDASYFGSMGGTTLNKPVVGMAATRDGRGYYLVASDGGIFAFGDAHYQGSIASMHLSQPVVGISADAATGGYWEAAADGGVFSFNAPYLGSATDVQLACPVVGISSTPTGLGYDLLAGDGGVFSYGDAHNYGSAAYVGGFYNWDPVLKVVTSSPC